MYTYAVGEVVLFYGETIPGRTDWHWMHPAYYPFFYNFGTESWVYYWVNSYGWFYDFGEGQWYLVGAP